MNHFSNFLPKISKSRIRQIFFKTFFSFLSELMNLLTISIISGFLISLKRFVLNKNFFIDSTLFLSFKFIFSIFPNKVFMLRYRLEFAKLKVSLANLYGNTEV